MIKIAVGTTNKAKLLSVESALKKCFPMQDNKNDCVNRSGDEQQSSNPPSFRVIGVPDIDSQVSAQPFSTEETRLGAYNRAKGALEHATDPECDFGVGMEGGIESAALPSLQFQQLQQQLQKQQLDEGEKSSTFFVVGWVCVIEKKTGKIGWGSSSRVELPKLFEEMLQFVALPLTNQVEKNNKNNCNNNYNNNNDNNSDNVLKPRRELAQVIDEVSKEHDLRSSLGVEGLLTNGAVLRSDAYEHAIIFAFSKFLFTPAAFWK